MLYLMIISMTVFLVKRNRKALIMSIIFLLAITTYETVSMYNLEKQNSIVVFCVKNHSLVGLVRGRKILFISDISDTSNITETFQVKNYLIKRGIKSKMHIGKPSETQAAGIRPYFIIRHEGRNTFFKAGHLKGLLLNDFHVLNQSSKKKLNLDCIILSNNVNVSMEQLTNLFVFRHLILDSSNRPSYRINWLNSILTDHHNLHSVADNRAIEIKSDYQIIKKK